MIPLKDLAIQKALKNDWNECCKINKKLLEASPNDIDTLNRLAFAYLKTGDYQKAEETYQTVLNLDASNPIASKNIKKLKSLQESGKQNTSNQIDAKDTAHAFIEEAGKTKIVNLINVADKKTLSMVQPSDGANLVIKRSKIFVQTTENTYIGMLPHDLGVRLIEYLNLGNTYKTYIKSVDEKTVTVFIKELERSKKLKNQPSFPNIPPAKKIKRRLRKKISK